MRKNKKSRVKVATANGVAEPASHHKKDQAGGGSPSPAGASPAAPDKPDAGTEPLRKELAEVKDQLLRARAEQQNIRKRSAQEVIDARRYANADLVRSLLGILDDFERTLEHSDDAEVETLRQGVRLNYDNFRKALREHRVEVIDPGDEAFDPRYHEALLQQPTKEKPPGTVIQVVQRGYRLDDRVLRPAKVIIAGRTGEAVDSGSDDSPEANTPISDTVQE